MDETVLKEVLLFYSSVVESLTESVLERVKKIDKKLDDLKTFLEDVFLTPEESVLLKDADRLIKGKRFKELTALDDVQDFPSQKRSIACVTDRFILLSRVLCCWRFDGYS